jgi:hypothetical protein
MIRWLVGWWQRFLGWVRLHLGSQVATLPAPVPARPRTPEPFTVVREPGSVTLYHGPRGAAARQVYEQAQPAPGESIELWARGERRGHRVG